MIIANIIQYPENFEHVFSTSNIQRLYWKSVRCKCLLRHIEHEYHLKEDLTEQEIEMKKG